MGDASSFLSLHLSLPNDCTPEEKEEAVLQLRRELLETDVKSVDSATGPSVPEGAKGLPPGLDTLLVTLAGSGSILGTVINSIANWSSERKKSSVTIKYKGNEFTFTNPSAEEQHDLVAACLARLSEEKG
jgi:hypothetical protein